jgi:hypothetical protein
MKEFKNKARKYGYIFGETCVGIGLLIVLFSIPFICIDKGDAILNWKAIGVMIFGFLMHWYGVYRTGGNIYED